MNTEIRERTFRKHNTIIYKLKLKKRTKSRDAAVKKYRYKRSRDK